jgi:hypothetical protein
MLRTRGREADELRRSTTSTHTAPQHGCVSQGGHDALLKTNVDEAVQALPLIASPTMIVALLSPEVREASSTWDGNLCLAIES